MVDVFLLILLQFFVNPLLDRPVDIIHYLLLSLTFGFGMNVHIDQINLRVGIQRRHSCTCEITVLDTSRTSLLLLRISRGFRK